MMPTVQQSAHDVLPYCGGKTRAGTPCQQPAGWGTEHLGTGRCKLHGGRNPTGPANGNYKHGLYAFKHHERVAAKLGAALQIPADDLGQELALTRALLSDYADNMVRTSSDNIEDVTRLVDSIRRTVDTIAKIRNNTALTGTEVQTLIAGLRAVLQKYVPADDLPDALDDLRRFVTTGTQQLH